MVGEEEESARMHVPRVNIYVLELMCLPRLCLVI